MGYVNVSNPEQLYKALPAIKAMLENPAFVAELERQGFQVDMDELRRLEWECVSAQARAMGIVDMEATQQRLLSLAVIALCAFSVGLAVAFAICTATGR